MSYLLRRFGSLAIPEIDGEQELITATFDMPTFPLAGSGAYDPYGTDRVPLSAPTIIPVRGRVARTTDAALRTQVNALRAACGTRDKLYAEVDGHNDVWWVWARLLPFQATRTVVLPQYLDTGLRFWVPQLLWNGLRRGTGGWTWDSGVEWDSGYEWDDAGELYPLTGSPQTISVPNTGNREVPDAVLTITAGTAPITSFRLVGNGADWTFSEANALAAGLPAGSGTIAAGGFLAIDTGAGPNVQSSTNGAVYGAWRRNAGHAIDEVLRLSPGNTSLTITYAGGGTGATVLCSYYEKWA